MAHQQVDMRPGRFARVMAWAKTRPQWQHEQEQLRQNAGQASEQELEVSISIIALIFSWWLVEISWYLSIESLEVVSYNGINPSYQHQFVKTPFPCI